MRQNRRRYARTTPMNHRLVAFFATLALVMVMGAMTSLSIKATIAKTGQEIVKLEHQLNVIRTERTRAEKKWAECTRPDQLDAALARHGLHMSLAGGERIVSLNGRRMPDRFDSVPSEVAANGKHPKN